MIDRKERLSRYSEPVTESGCLLWIGATDGRGYGTITINNKQLSTHRVAYEEAHGEIPPGKQVNHHCDVRCCINPDHLYAGSQSENMLDKFRRKRHSLKGSNHPYSKLTENDVKIIKKRLKLGHLHKDIATSFGVTRRCITWINSGKTWEHVNGSE